MKKFGSDKPRKFGPSGKPKFSGGKPDSKPRKKFGGDNPRDFSAGGARSFGDRKKPGGFKPRPYESDREDFGSDKPRSTGPRPKFGSDKPRFGEKPRFGTPRPRPYESNREESGSDRPRTSGARPKFGSDKPRFGEKPRFGSPKPRFGAGKPKFGSDRPSYGRKPGFGDDRPSFADREQGERGDYSDSRPRKSGYGSSKFGSKPARPFGSDRPKKFGDKPSGAYGDRKPAKFGKRDERPRPEPYRIWKRDEAEAAPVPEKPRYREADDSFEYEQERESAPASSRASRYNRDWVEAAATDSEPVTRTFPSAPFAKKLVVTMAETRNVPIRLVWVFDTMVDELPDGEPSAGETVYVHDSSNKFLGSAIYNPNSRIRARIFSLDKELFNQTYIKNAIGKSIEFRKQLGYLEEGSCRVIFGESDGIPGLVADLIGGFLVIQPLTYAVDMHIPFIVDQLNEQVGPEGIVVRNDVPVRAKEGLEVGGVVTHGDVPEQVLVKEAGYVLFANPASGQKTGMFLDQRKNRAAIKQYCKSARVLDLFCHVGGWAMRAAKYGATEVIGVDSSKPALELARQAAEENGFNNVSFVEDDVFDYFAKLGGEEDSLFDVIICDPPAFAKTRAHFEEAIKAYLSLNYRAMKRLKPGGVLVTCSCSQAVSSEEFTDMLTTAARNARGQFQIIEKRGAPQDHPVLLGLPETDYLKCFVLRKSE